MSEYPESQERIIPGTQIVFRCEKCGSVYIAGGKCPYCAVQAITSPNSLSKLPKPQRSIIKEPVVLIRNAKGWSTEPKDRFEDIYPDYIYDFILAVLCQGKEVIVSRTGSLMEISDISPETEFYYNRSRDRIYIVGDSMPSEIKGWDVWGTKFIRMRKTPSAGSTKIEPIIIGIFTGTHIYLMNPIPGLTSIIENSIDVACYVKIGVWLHMRIDEKITKSSKGSGVMTETAPSQSHEKSSPRRSSIIAGLSSDSRNVIIQTPQGLKEVTILGNPIPGSILVGYDFIVDAFIMRTPKDELIKCSLSDASLSLDFRKSIITYYLERISK